MKNCLFHRKDLSWRFPFSSYFILSKSLLVIFFFAAGTTLMAQTPVTGVVAAGDSLVDGATVQVKGTTNATQTDATGRFSIDAASNATLLISHVAYEPMEVKVNNRKTLSIQLTALSGQLGDVVVIGYGTQRRRDVIGAVSSIQGAKIATRPVSTFDQALQGMAPGLQIAQRNSSPGELSTINLRGIGSLSAGFEPLFVVDGFPTDQRNATAINPADIQSIEILKDAAATAIFGSRGANGVIIITTKTGRGKPQLNVNISAGYAKVNKNDLYDAASGAEYVQYYKEYYTNLGLNIPPAINNWDGTNTNWQDLIYQTGPFQNYSVSVNGGDQKVSYLFSGNYTHQVGTIIGEGFDKYSARIKVDYRPFDFFSLGVNLAPNFEITKRSSPRESDWGSLQSMATLLPPIVPVRNADGSYATFDDVLPGVFQNIGNPLEVAENYKDKTNRSLSLFNTYAQVRIIENLLFKTSIGAGLTYNNGKVFYTAPPGTAVFTLPATTTLSLNNSQTINWLIENTLNYKKVINTKHSFDLLAGYTSQKVTTETLAGSTNTFDIPGPQTLAFGSSVNRTANNGITGNTLISYLGRMNYSFMDKYIFTGSIRTDGSSRFGPNNRYQTFGSIGLGWRITEEKFMQGQSFIKNAKIRGSYGTTGSNDISDFAHAASLRSVNQSFNGAQVIGVRNQDPGNATLSWKHRDK
jgi:TonB-linked SusC/RagA family outer membrane protein